MKGRKRTRNTGGLVEKRLRSTGLML